MMGEFLTTDPMHTHIITHKAVTHFSSSST